METQIPDARLYKWIGNNEGHASEQPRPANASGVVAHHESHGPAPKNATPSAAIDRPAFGSSALGHKPAFKLQRFLSVTSFLGVAAVIVGLLLFNRHFAFRALMEHETRSNVALTQAFANTHWPQYSAFVEGAQRLGGKEKLLEQPEIARLRADLLRQMKGISVVKVKIYDLGGLTVFSTDAKQIGEDKSKNVGFLSARSGVTASDITFRQSFDAFEQVINDRNLVFSYIPIRDSATSRIEGVFEVYSDVSELVAQIEKTQWRIVAAVVGSLSLLYLFLFLLVRRADRIVSEQSDEERLVSQERLRHQAFHDPLTGLPNRAKFAERLDDAIKGAKRNGRPFAVLFVDLDHFKYVNDSLGHVVGDQLLRAVARRLAD